MDPQQNPTPELLAALAQFQSEHIGAPKDVKGRYDYSSLESLIHAVQPSTALGLCHTFICTPLGGDQTQISLYLFHTKGGFISSSLVIDDFDPKVNQSKSQQRGSAFTYAKRYLIAALYGLAPGGDQGEGDDVGAAVKPLPKQQKPPAAKQAPPKPAPTSQPKEEVKFLSDDDKALLISQIAGLEKGAREKLMLDFKDAFDIRCAGTPDRSFINLQSHGDWLAEKLGGITSS